MTQLHSRVWGRRSPKSRFRGFPTTGNPLNLANVLTLALLATMATSQNNDFLKGIH